jgi:hypothetical protein
VRRKKEMGVERQKKEHERERMRKQRFIIISFYTIVDVTE